MKSYLPENSIFLGKLKIIEVYDVFDDVATLFLAENDSQELFLVFWMWEDLYFEKWFYAKISSTVRTKLVKKEISFAEAFELGQTFYLVDLCNSKNFIKEVKFNDDYVPYENTYVEQIIPFENIQTYKDSEMITINQEVELHDLIFNGHLSTRKNRSVELIQLWIIKYGSPHLARLFPNFNYIDTFIKEYFAGYKEYGWELKEFSPLFLVRNPSEKVLERYHNALEKLQQDKTLANIKSPSLYNIWFRYYIGYPVYYQFILCRNLKEFE